VSVPQIITEVMFNSPTWTDISTYVRRLNIKRGSNRVDSPILLYDAGTATIDLDNRDRRFDPTNLAGPYVSNTTMDTGTKLLSLDMGAVLPFAHGVTATVKSAAGLTASILNITASASGTTGSFTVAKPSGTANGQRMLAFHTADIGVLADLTISGGSAWTLLGSITAGTDALQTKVWYKTAGGAEPASYTFGQNAGADGVAAVVTFSNADTGAVPVIALLNSVSAGTITTPSTTPVGTNDVDLRWGSGSWGADSPYSWSPPSGYTEYVDKQSGVYTTAALCTTQLTSTGTGTDTRILPMRPIRVKALWSFDPTTNLIENPSFEVNTTGWAPSGTAAIETTLTPAYRGGYSLQVSRLVTSPPFQIYGAVATGTAPLATVGMTVTITAYVYIPTASYAKINGIAITGTGLAATFVTGPPVANQWARIRLTQVVSATLDDVQIQFWTDDTHTDGQVIAYIDAVQAEVRSTPSDYCDGSQPGCTWSGTANNSSSSRPATFTFPLFSGRVDQWNITWVADVESEVSVPCTDAFKVLGANIRLPVAPVGAGESSSARVTRILDGISWPAGDRLISTGDSTVQATTLEGDVLSELQLVTDSELGELFVDGQGRVVWRNRQFAMSQTTSTNVQARFGDGGDAQGEIQYDDVTLSNDDSQLVNQVRATRVGGVQQSVEDAASIADFLTHTFERSDLLLNSDPEALSWAQWILYQSKDPELRFDTLRIKPQKDQWESILFPLVLGFEIGHRLLVRRRPVGAGTSLVEREVFIRGIEFQIEQYDWTVVYTLQSATRFGSFLTLGHPVLGKIGRNALVF
jgi:hypothetical protein